jgi:formylglycine-generating enzyme required for sulfatase activity
MQENYTVFVHVVRADGATLTQRDVEPRDGTHPTGSWVTGELVGDPHELSIPGDAPPDTYWIKVGMYSSATVQRLPVVDPGEATVLHDSVLVKELRVVPAQALPAATPEHERIWERDGSLMVLVPAGEFLMGSKEDDPDAEDDEHPQHTVYVNEFWIDKTEVTNEQYRKCVEAGTCRAPTTCDWGEPTYSDLSKTDRPVVCVSWQDAKAYCEWAGKRLPTEAEWEKAARGTDGRRYPWGNSFDGSKVNFCDVNCEFDHKDSGADDGYPHTAPVGSYPEGASRYGALDMAGNVWEWCQDWYGANYYAHSSQHDPQGPSSGEGRVFRGGSWSGNKGDVRAANRCRNNPDDRHHNGGFRCVSQSP